MDPPAGLWMSEGKIRRYVLSCMVMIEDFEGDSAAVALGRLIVREGLAAPSVRSIAVETNMSPSGMLKRFDDKGHLLARASRAFAARFKAELQEQTTHRRWSGFVPEDERGLFWIRVFCARPLDAEAASRLWSDALGEAT